MENDAERKTAGRNAREKVLARHHFAIASQKIFDTLEKAFRK